MRNTGRILIFWLLLVVTATSAARAEPVRFHTLDIPPYGFTDAAGMKHGMLYDIANVIADEAGLNISHDLVPLARIVKEVQQGVPLCTIVTKSPFSESMATAVAHTGQDTVVAAVARKGIILKNYEDLYRLDVVITRGSYIGHKFDKDTLIKKRFANDGDQGVRMLQRGRVDAMVAPLETTYFNMAKNGYDRREVTAPVPLVSREFWLHCTKNSFGEGLITTLRNATQKLAKAGTLAKIWDGYLH